ncbi:MAG: type IV pilus twitching motility protein PilT [Candidatus Hydrogenedentota bacterium]
MEIVLGLGKRDSLLKLLHLSEETLFKTQGIPRTVILRARSVEIIGERPDYDSDFYEVKFRCGKVSNATSTAIDEVVSEYSDVCKRTEEDGAIVLSFAMPEGGQGNGRLEEASTAFAKRITLPEVWRVAGEHYRADHISTEKLFKALVNYKASDVHLAPGEKPVFRVDNETQRSDLYPPLSAAQINALIHEVAGERYWKEFKEDQQTSFNFHQVGLGYARVSAFIKSGAPHVTFRYLPEEIPSFEDLSIPSESMHKLGSLHHGLVLVTGMTGSGKSTTVAALVDWINSNRTCHILTIENPIEYVQTNKKALVSQRGTGVDVATFNLAVTGALRHDPDVIVIGEMRDPDTIRSAINAAATGHLVISTLHSNTAYEVVNRIVSFFDPVERDLVRLQLRDSLSCVICQRLLPKKGGGRLPALEFMFNDVKAINDSIIEGHTDGIRIGMQQTVSHSFIFETYLLRLYKEGKIDLEMARRHATDPSILDQMVMGTYSVPRLDSLKGLKDEH